MNDIRERIEFMRRVDPHQLLGPVADTMEKLLVVYEAADALLRIDNPLTNEFMELGKAVADCDKQ